jgi:hypothetical protein
MGLSKNRQNFTAEDKRENKECRSTCPGFTSGDLKIYLNLSGPLRKNSVNSAVPDFLDSPGRVGKKRYLPASFFMMQKVLKTIHD